MADPNAGDDSNARTHLMREVAEQMDAIEADFGDDFEILASITIVMLKRPDGTMGIRVRNANVSPFEGIGILSMAQDSLKAMAQQQPPGGSED